VHGQLRRIHIPHRILYTAALLAFLSACSLFGFVSSSLRMVWKVANYNSLRSEVDQLRQRYAQLQRQAQHQDRQLASFQLLASEITTAYGLKQAVEEPVDIASEGRLAPTVAESLQEFNSLRSAKLSLFNRQSSPWQRLTETPGMWPVQGRLMSSFGERHDPFTREGAFHTGVDIDAPTGTPVLSTAAGTVVHAEYNGRYGRLVVVDHSDGFSTYYAHLSRIDVLPGQQVRRGDTVGAVGATGRATGSHLHYEVRRGGVPLNPYPFLGRFALARQTRKDLPF
jgi:murein DD-endopeptidase MepM/ murein hydrolase activator NlpD